MNMKYSTILILLISTFVGWCVGEMIKKQVSKPTTTALQYVPEQDRLRNLIDSLPDTSPMKVNLIVLLASELNGDSKELSEILMTYTQLKLSEFKKENP